MCGIISYNGREEAMPILLDGLRRLEYRGYDSAGMAVLYQGKMECRRQKGKIQQLASLLSDSPLAGGLGIAHTRWATHGEPSERNSHPHITERVAVIHNGIIENFQTLRQRLIEKGAVFKTDTDTEVIPHLIEDYLSQGLSLKEAVQAMTKVLEGSYACVVMSPENDGELIAVKKDSPMVIGYGADFNMVSSDCYAIAPYTQRVCYPEDGDVILIGKEQVTIYNGQGQPVDRHIKQLTQADTMVTKGDYRHFMHKEIYEQPSVIHESFHHYVSPAQNKIESIISEIDSGSIDHIHIVACGTSYYSGVVAQYWIEELVGIPVEVFIASEYRYRKIPFRENGLVIGISQSGETADTLAALSYAKLQGQKVMSLVNVVESSMARLAHVTMPIFAGPEIGVASTKAFTAQLMTLAIWTLTLAQAKSTMDKDTVSKYLKQLMLVPGYISQALSQEQAIQQVAKELSHAQTILYVGRGSLYPIALEGALKLKELSYIHAEGVAAGELKHGPIALIDETVPIIALVPADPLMFAKLISNLQEIAARGGRIIAICQQHQEKELYDIATRVIHVPQVDAWVSPMIYAIPTQLLAYHTALEKGTDVDQPRNLAKSVTVE